MFAYSFLLIVLILTGLFLILIIEEQFARGRPKR